jgi:uncharacterized membrane protein YccC
MRGVVNEKEMHMKIHKNFVGAFLLLGSLTQDVNQVHAVDTSKVPTPVIQYRPDAPRDLTSYDTETRSQMTDIDKQIQKLTADREAIRAKSTASSLEAKELLAQYQQLIDIEQNYQQQMQSLDDNVTQLVRRKAELAKQLKK